MSEEIGAFVVAKSLKSLGLSFSLTLLRVTMTCRRALCVWRGGNTSD